MTQATLPGHVKGGIPPLQQHLLGSGVPTQQGWLLLLVFAFWEVVVDPLPFTDDKQRSSAPSFMAAPVTA